MADETSKRREDERLDASLSVLGDEAKEPHVGRVGSAPRPADDGDMEKELNRGEPAPEGGNLDPKSQRAANEAIADVAADAGKR
ncbi:hypothetical protein [Aureimonas mangrovi]|uniref:hypothetical protein n=1 Tax=Aureimonas mangrovi TaxID=2758041 RepID=UPI00163DD70C|nr:hypothetical protein [Aureimonas mangrovi]